MRIFLSLLFLAASITMSAQPRASISYATFLSDESPYVEVYITIERASLKPIAGKPLATEFTVIINDATQTVTADKVRIEAPPRDSSNNFVQALRYPLDNGQYTLSIVGVDANNPQLSLKLNSPVVVDFKRDELNLSDIELASSVREIQRGVDVGVDKSVLAKGNYFLEPLPQNFIRRGQKSFTAYLEAYTPTTEIGESFVLEYTVMALQDSEAEPIELFRKTRRFEATEPVTPFITKLSTKRFPSGNYALRVTLRDRALQDKARRITLFTVSNPSQDVAALGKPSVGYEESWVQQLTIDSLEYALIATLPTLPGPEVEYVNEVIKGQSIEAMRLAVYNHFLGESAQYPEVAYNAYMKVAKEVDYAFQSGFGRGFQTDRGFIYLKYGQPDDRVIVNDDPSAPPYEIWVYNYVELTRESPGKFLFYNQVLDNASYVLLHSTVRGEINEPQWRRYLYSRSADEFGDVDQVQGTDIGDNVGRYADQYFADF